MTIDIANSLIYYLYIYTTGKDGDLHKVFDAVYDCRAKWYNLCLALQVSDDDLSAIKREHRDIATCLLRGISLWLQRVHSYGPPTWRVLVDAIANSSGGDNHVLALELADKHQGKPPNSHVFDCLFIVM